MSRLDKMAMHPTQGQAQWRKAAGQTIRPAIATGFPVDIAGTSALIQSNVPRTI